MIRLGAANHLEDLTVLAKARAAEVLLGSSDLSRYGTIPQDQLIHFAQTAKNLGLKTILEWDILMTQPEFDKAAALLKALPLNEFNAIRVQDPGAFEWVLKNFPALKIQLNLETGNHNLEGVLAWCRYGGKNLERVILSSQLPASTLRDWIKKIPVGVEVLGLGPVLILYTPRHLLTNQLPETEAARTCSKTKLEKGLALGMSRDKEGEAPMLSEARATSMTKSEAMPKQPLSEDGFGIGSVNLRATASSEESFHSGFRVLENKHGTLVFLGKDYCLMELIEEIETLGLAALRIDLRLNEDAETLKTAAGLFTVTENLAAADMLENYPVETTRCFYKSNNTDKAFVRLKNENLTRRDENYLGEVVEAAKDSHLIIHVRARGKKLCAGQKLLLINPHGEEHPLTVSSLQTIESRAVAEIQSGDYAVIPFVRLVPAKSAVYQA